MLHDTYGFPVELTAEIAAERKVGLDMEGFEAAMARQRELARTAAGGGAGDERASQAAGRLVAELAGLAPTEFLGYEELRAQSKLVKMLKGRRRGPKGAKGNDREGTPSTNEAPSNQPTLEVFVERTPFYAESGGQVGDTGTIVSETGRARVIDTDSPLEGMIRHRCAWRRAPWWRAKRPRWRSTRSVATRSGAATQRPTFCTGPCARRSARNCNSRDRSWNPTTCALTSTTTPS